MAHKNKANLHERRRRRDQHRQASLAATGHDIGRSPRDAIPGLAPKTTRYMLGMLGGGNVQVPDTHFTRYLFGLEKGQQGQPIDNYTIEKLKDVLWNETNGHVLDAIDRYYAQNHDAVKHMMRTRSGASCSGNPEDAVFPAFWKNWVSIIPTRTAAGLANKDEASNEGTDHRVFWDNTIPHAGQERGHGPGPRRAHGHAAREVGARLRRGAGPDALLPPPRPQAHGQRRTRARCRRWSARQRCSASI
jgi:hypothetical protein